MWVTIIFDTFNTSSYSDYHAKTIRTPRARRDSPGKKETQMEPNKLFQSLDTNQWDVVLYLIHATPPVSIDTLSVLSGTPAVRILNLMEDLKKKKIAYEKKTYGRGIYFLNNGQFTDFVQNHTPKERTCAAITRIIEFYSQSMLEGNEKTLILAELYRKLEDSGDGLKLIKKAADILHQSGEHEKAIIFYDYILDRSSTAGLTDITATDFLESLLIKISSTERLMPVQEQLSLLNKAQKIAVRYEKWDSLANINLTLGQLLQAAGEQKKAFHHMDAFWKLAQKISNQRVLTKAALLMTEFLYWKGKYSEVVDRYEKVVGGLEEFGDDETTLKAGARVGLCYVRCGRIARGMGMIDAVRVKANLLNLQQVAIFADLMTILALFELRKLTEAEFYLDRIKSLPEEVVGHYVLWPVEACIACILCTREDYRGASDHLERAIYHSRLFGWTHHSGPWNFEYLDTLESRGFFQKEMNYDSEIRKMLKWDHLYMKGVAYRYRALRNVAKDQNMTRILADLKNSEKYLKRSGGEIELARTRIALGNAYLKKGEAALARSYLEKAWSFFSKVDRNLFPKDLLVIMPQEQKIEVMIDRIININESLGAIQDLSSFLERVINVAMDFTMAMRGAFFVFHNGREPTIIASRNLDPSFLKTEQFKLIREIVLKTADRDFTPQPPRNEVTTSNETAPAAGIYSHICMPARLGTETHGYLYLDNRLGGQQFPENHLLYVGLLCNQIAVGLSNIRTYEEMRNLKERFEDEAIFYKQEMGLAKTPTTIMGKSKEIMGVIGQIGQVAPTDSSVLVTGETGVGKELVAKAVYRLSTRKDGPFIPVNLAALPPDLVASELFGHEKGAFTGANDVRKGRFELAHRGTIFLDEIGDLPLNVQVKLLRVLQEGVFERLGSAVPIRSDFRVIAATNKDLPREVENGNFRQDLYYRLSVFPIHVPPLRDRNEDIPLLAHHFVERFSKKMGRQILKITAREVKKLMEYHWPGNVRELEHFVERAVILSKENHITFDGLSHSLNRRGIEDESSSTLLADIEREHIEKILSVTHWRVSGPNGAAAMLGLKRSTLLFRMKKLGIRGASAAGY
jgi:transcriptional regulator with GAF, ATPase, and Fis domain/tetratricopeptide (TPR) repeat protein